MTLQPPVEERGARWYALGALGVCVSAYCATWSSGVGLGDAPESVAGLHVAGIVHAPGYVAYTSVGWLFERLVPVGASAAANLFSLVCTVAALCFTYRAARRLGASALGATVGVVGLGFAASVWYFSGAAEHNAFTLAFSAAAIAVLARVAGERQPPRAWWLAAALVAATTAAGTYTAVPLGVALLAVAVARRRTLGRAAVVGSLVVMVFVTGANATFTVARANADPAVNWGQANSVGRWFDLVTAADFRGTSNSAGRQSPSTAGDDPGHDLAAVPSRTVNYFAVLFRDLGAAVMCLAGFGAFVLWRRRSAATVMLGALVAANVAFMALTVGIHPRGFEAGLDLGALIQPGLLAVTLAAALGATALLRAASTWRPSRLDSRLVTLAILVVVVVPAVVTRYPTANQRHISYADLYANDVFDELPHGSVLLVWGAERAFPLWEHQIVDHERPDVVVIAGDLLDRPWYRSEIASRIGRVADVGDAFHNLIALTHRLLGARPVTLDSRAWVVLGNQFRLEQLGLTARVRPGTPHTPPANVATLVRRLDRIAARPALASGSARRWPNAEITGSYVHALILASNAAGALNDVADQREELQLVLRLDLHNQTVREALVELDSAPQ